MQVEELITQAFSWPARAERSSMLPPKAAEPCLRQCDSSERLGVEGAVVSFQRGSLFSNP